MVFSEPFRDTAIAAKDSVSLSFRFQVPVQVKAEQKHEIIIRIYSMQNKLLSEKVCIVHPEAYHDWDVTLSDKRIFFYPRTNLAQFEVLLQNKGNTAETIRLFIQPDQKLNLDNTGDWRTGENIILEPFQDSLLKFNIRYTFSENRIFDVSKVMISASTVDKSVQKQFLIEKYNDTYAPFYIDRALPHQIEAGFRSFSGNTEFLPFIKARGTSTFKNLSTFQYNFNYYSLTGNENLISNSYYSFLYKWKQLKAGIGAFSSQLGRNLYTRHGLMLSNSIRLSPVFSLEAFVSQSFFTPKTSVAVGYTFEKNKLLLHGSFAHDVDNEKKINTSSAMLQSNKIPIFKNQSVTFNLYGYNEYHYHANDYTLLGYAWDLNYNAIFFKVLSLQFVNNFGSPDIPGPQMGLVNFIVSSSYSAGERKRSISATYMNSSRSYHNYSFEGVKLPEIYLYDQYANFFFHSNKRPNHIWQAGPSVESYISSRYSADYSGKREQYTAQKFRFEYKASIFKYLTVNLKTGVSDISIKATTEYREQRIDFHLLGGYTFKKGFGLSVNYDNGPLVNSGLYQSSGDVENQSLSIGPSLMSTYFKERLSVNLFANVMYRFDLQYASFNINPKIEAYLFRDFYLVASGTYHFTRQEYADFSTQNSYTYFEFSIKKRFGKSDLNEWQRETRQLKVILFKDDNGNGVKEDTEEGVPFVKTRLQLTNAADPELRNEFPVDIILLSNTSGVVLYNRLPKGFYDLTITPLGDVKEYFYVNRSAEKLEVSKNAVYFVPFQKANKITGKIVVTRQKFIKKGEETLDLGNIKITAYNRQGNSYSSFTLTDGSFTIFVPQNNTYFLRMPNVFGPGYKILQNDISITIGQSTDNQVVFNVSEIGRQVKFKETKPAEPDTTQQTPLKIKVLHGKFYENSSNVPVSKDILPEFGIKEAPIEDHEMISGNFYVAITADSSRTESEKLIRIIAENGIACSLGYNKTNGLYYVFTKYFRTRAEATEEIDRLKKAGLKEAVIFKY